MISHYFVYKRALLAEAEQLTRADVLRKKEDIGYLTFNAFVVMMNVSLEKSLRHSLNGEESLYCY